MNSFFFLFNTFRLSSGSVCKSAPVTRGDFKAAQDFMCVCCSCNAMFLLPIQHIHISPCPSSLEWADFSHFSNDVQCVAYGPRWLSSNWQLLDYCKFKLLIKSNGNLNVEENELETRTLSLCHNVIDKNSIARFLKLAVSISESSSNSLCYNRNITSGMAHHIQQVNSRGQRLVPTLRCT